LHAELVLEGLKAYQVGQSRPNLFRPRENARRLDRSAQRLSMPTVPESLFLRALETVTDACAPLAPRSAADIPSRFGWTPRSMSC